MTTIVVGYAPGHEGDAAIDASIEEARIRRAGVLVVNSSPGDRYADPSFATAEQLETLRHRFERAGVGVAVRQPVRGQDAAEEILAAVREADASLAVVGVKHRSPVGKLLLGSTAQRVILGATCPVLSVKP